MSVAVESQVAFESHTGVLVTAYENTHRVALR